MISRTSAVLLVVTLACLTAQCSSERKIQRCGRDLMKTVFFACIPRGGIYTGKETTEDTSVENNSASFRLLTRKRRHVTNEMAKRLLQKRSYTYDDPACEMHSDESNLVYNCCCKPCSMNYIYGFCNFQNPIQLA